MKNKTSSKNQPGVMRCTYCESTSARLIRITKNTCDNNNHPYVEIKFSFKCESCGLAYDVRLRMGLKEFWGRIFYGADPNQRVLNKWTEMRKYIEYIEKDRKRKNNDYHNDNRRARYLKQPTN